MLTFWHKIFFKPTKDSNKNVCLVPFKSAFLLTFCVWRSHPSQGSSTYVSYQRSALQEQIDSEINRTSLQAILHEMAPNSVTQSAATDRQWNRHNSAHDLRCQSD